MLRTRHGTGRLVVLLIAVLMGSRLNSAFAEPVTTIRASGASTNRLDIVVLGDGYTANELTKYASDVETFLHEFFLQTPFAEYQRYFNVHRIDVVSNQSGADHPDRTPQVFRDTALNAAYNCAGIQRLICVDTARVNAVLSRSTSADMRDAVLVLVNDQEYGGSGGAVAVASLDSAVIELVLHEMGHSFGLLTDEYGGPPPPACDASQEPPETNATKQTVPQLIKWAAWIDPSTPIPTTGPTDALPGLYAGAKYCDSTLFRPTYDSKMRSLSRPFEQVNSEQLVKRLYNWASPIDATEPRDPLLSERPGESQPFHVQPLEPSTHPLEIRWTVDGRAAGTDSDFFLNASDWGLGRHIIRVVVSDPTSMVRNDPAGLLSATRSWQVDIAANACASDITDQLSVQRSAFQWNRATGR